MNEIEKNKKVEFQTEIMTLDKNKKLSLDSKQWDLTKKSTAASYNPNGDANQSQTSVQIIYGENKFKLQYDKIKKEAEILEKEKKRYTKFQIKIDHRQIAKNRVSSMNMKDNSIFRSELIKVKSNNDQIIEINNNKKQIDYNNSCKNVSFNSINPEKRNRRERKDAFGIPIVKNNLKKFKVSFLDLLQENDGSKKRKNLINNKASSMDIGSNKKNNNNFYIGECNLNNHNQREFIEVIKVESYKKYNINIFEDDDNSKVICKPYGCVIF